MAEVVTYAVAGAGGRGRTYATWVAEHPDRARVVAVAEPEPVVRQAFAEAHGIAPENQFESWQDMVQASKVAQAVIVSTQDDMHVEPATAFLAAGYDVLLEKPMAPTQAGCEQIAAAARASGQIFAVCHVLRFTPYTKALRKLLDDDAIGEVMSIEHLEPVGWQHQAHSYVRGNWRNEKLSSFMLLAKSCHDIDWLQFIVGRPIVATSSFGRLSHFTAQNKPEGSADRCLECPLQDTCAYSATRIYLDRARQGEFGWPVDVIAPQPTVESVTEALRVGPYGRCVYACDNDVVDHQVASFEFEGGATGVFTMTAFDQGAFRKTRIFGSQGRIEGDGDMITVLDFRTGEQTVHDANTVGGADAGGGHGGGDAGLMDAFTAAVAAQDQSLVSSDADQTLASHTAVFATERARVERRLVEL